MALKNSKGAKANMNFLFGSVFFFFIILILDTATILAQFR